MTAERYRGWVESPSYMEAPYRTFPDYCWTRPNQKRKLRIQQSSQRTQLKKFRDYGNIRPLTFGNFQGRWREPGEF